MTRQPNQPGSAVTVAAGALRARAARRLLVVFLPFALLATPAAAAQFHGFTGSFGSHGTAAGQLGLVPPKFGPSIYIGQGQEHPEMKEAGSGLAVDQATGDVYVADTGNHRVEEFSSAGVFIRAWGWGVATGASESQVCTTTCQAGLPGAGPGQFTDPIYVAIDNTPTGASDVYVADFATGIVQKFSPTGSLITSWGGSPAPGQLSFPPLEGIAVRNEGSLLVFYDPGDGSTAQYSAFAQSSGVVEGSSAGLYGRQARIGDAFDPAGRLYQGNSPTVPIEVIQASLANEGSYKENFVLDAGSATGVAVNPADEDVYVADYNSTRHRAYVSGYDSQGNALEPEIGGNGEITETAGLAVYGLDGDLYVADPGAERIEVFAPGGPRAALTVALAGTGLGSVTSEPAGLACPASNCTAHFPVGETVTLTATAPPHATFVGWSGGGGCAGSAPCQITLAASTVVTANFAYDRPALIAVAASAIARHTATLLGAVDPEGDASSCSFEYGPTSAYGAEAPCSPQPGSGAAPVAVGAQLWDLAAATTYHYRLVSANSGGAAYGPDETFTTLAEGCSVNTALCPVPPAAPSLASVAPGPVPAKGTGGATSRALTGAQQFARALKACRKHMRKSARASCEKQARKRYGPANRRAGKSVRRGTRG